MKEPVDHIERPRLPWRCDEPGLTECGYDASKVKSLTREQFFQRVKDLGQQRTAMLTCMTCSDTARRWNSWEEDPRQALGREITWERDNFYRARNDRGERLKDELIAVAELVEAHRDQFNSIILARQQRREWIEKKIAAESRKKSATPKGQP